MILTRKLLDELQKRLKIGNRRGVHLNAIPSNSNYKFDINRLSHIDKDLPNQFIKCLLSEQPLKFKISWKNNVPDLNTLFEEEQVQLVKITKSFENLINQTETIESEKGINTFGFGYPVLVRRDTIDNKLTVSPILIWSLRIKRTKEFNTWEITRNEDDPIYLNEVLINHIYSDTNIQIDQISNDILDDGLINKEELLDICIDLIKKINPSVDDDIRDVFSEKIDNIKSIGDKNYYEKLPLNSTNSFIDFGGLFSIFEVQKQNIINDYNNLFELEGLEINTNELKDHYFQPISSVETDPSQQGVLNGLKSNRNIIIQGPPGTGKSQTLTAVLINALENNKKTIVVCEKRTALDVLHKSLLEKGLNSHCVLIQDIIKDRKTVVDSVRDRVDNSSYRRYQYKYSKDILDDIISKASKLIDEINISREKIHKPIFGDNTWTDLVGWYISENKNNKEDFSNILLSKDEFQFTSQELNYYIDLLDNGNKYFLKYKEYEKFSFLNKSKLTGENPYLLEQKLKEDFKYYDSKNVHILGLYEDFKNEYFDAQIKISEHRTNQFDELKIIYSEFKTEILGLTNKFIEAYKVLRISAFQEQADQFKHLARQIDVILEKYSSNDDIFDEIKTNDSIYKLKSLISKNKRKILKDYSELQRLFYKLDQIFLKCKDFEGFTFTHPELNKNLENYKEFEALNSILENDFSSFIDKELSDLEIYKIEKLELTLEKINIFQSNQTNSEITRLFDSLKEVLSIYFNNIINNFNIFHNNYFKSELNKEFDFSKYSARENYLTIIESEINEYENNIYDILHSEFEALPVNAKIESYNSLIFDELLSEIISLVKRITEDGWAGVPIKDYNLDNVIDNINTFTEKYRKYYKQDIDLFIIEFNWINFYSNLSDSTKKIVNQCKEKENWKKIFLLFYLENLLISKADIKLPTNDDNINQLDETLKDIEKEQLNFIKQYWFSKQIDETAKFEEKHGNLTVENLYIKRSGNKHKRQSLRQIVQFDADLFTTFFPIILTTPDVCSNLFKGMNDYFDIVMFDEASQLKLEDNLPALLKGKQIIVAGDEHQMPPSNYFSKIFEGEYDDDEDIDEDIPKINKDLSILDCESLLDFANELNFEKKHLDFHYRSKHPYLIDFSNYAFYQQRLKPLPNNFDYNPISYIQVNGTFSDHTNEIEAEMVLSILEHNINRLPNGNYPTVGIATFNISQRNLIKSKLIERQKFSKFKDFNDKIIELEENGLFVKNLENIQGDERDIIIISTTYGINKDGRFVNRFGPINHSKGYKLLNVIITRAKFKIFLCTSIPENKFLNYKEDLIIEGQNNRKAVFFAYLAYCKAVSEGNNENRISILSALGENSPKSVSFDSLPGDLESPFEEEVYQELYNVFGSEKIIPQYKFAGFRIDLVFDHKIHGVPKIAIECDGAKYHSSDEAYLYDRHRQKILEEHGFVFHRIWSTNWWRNTNREIKKMLNFIEEVKNIKTSTNTKGVEYSKSFEEKKLSLNSLLKEKSNETISTDKEFVETLDFPVDDSIIVENKIIAQLNSKIKVRYLNNNKELKIQIVETEKPIKNENDTYQKLYYKSPLCVAILGSSVGDIVKIGNLDNYVELIEIID